MEKRRCPKTIPLSHRPWVCGSKFNTTSRLPSAWLCRILCRANEEIFDSEQRADYRNVHLERHVDRFHEWVARLTVIPVVRRWKPSVNLKYLLQTASKLFNWLNIVIEFIYI